MKALMSTCAAFFGALVLASCSGASVSPAAAPRMDYLMSQASPTLYAATKSKVYEIDVRSRRVRRVIRDGIDFPTALAFDASGDLYVANLYSDSVTVYDRSGELPVRTIKDGVGTPIALAIDRSGTLYVSDGKTPPRVNAYAPGSSRPERTIVDPNGETARAMAVGPYGVLYIGYQGYVTAYSPSGTRLGSIQGMFNVLAFAFHQDTIAIANGRGGTRKGYVVLQRGPFSTIVDDKTESCDGVAFASNGTLYVLNVVESGQSEPNYVTAYAPESNKLLYVIGGKDEALVKDPRAIVSTGSELYVASETGVSVIAERESPPQVSYVFDVPDVKRMAFVP